jgi:hypothetical protein
VFPAGLTELYLSGLTALPAGIVWPAGLTRLDLSGLTALPAGIVWPAGLTRLYLSGLRALPAGFVWPAGLTGLWLSGKYYGSREKIAAAPELLGLAVAILSEMELGNIIVEQANQDWGRLLRAAITKAEGEIK